MPTFCKRCALHIMDGVASCPMCGSTMLAPEPDRSASTTLTAGGQSDYSAGSSNLINALAISLAIAPFLRLYAIFTAEVPALNGEQNQALLESHPGLSTLIYIEILINVLLIAAAPIMNYLFYTKRKSFPIYMVAFVTATLLSTIVAISGLHFLVPEENLNHTYYPLLRSMIWAGTIIPYLLTSHDVKARFDR
jgi:hypothetical protein